MATSTGRSGSSASVGEPGPAQRAMLEVYLEAERALLGSIAAEVRGVVDADDDRTDARRAAGIRNVASAALATFHALEGQKAALVGAVLNVAREQGAGAAAAQLGAAFGRAPGRNAVPVTALDRLAASVVARIGDAHLAVLRTTVDTFRTVVAQVLPAAIVGAETRRTVTQRALWQLTDTGIVAFRDSTGRRWTLAAYTEMAVRAGAARAAVDGHLDTLAAADRDLVIVSGSGDRCPKCRAWSGKVLSISGRTVGTIRVEHPIRDGEYVTVRVAGSVEEARADGLLHPQCRCSLSAYLPGVTKPEPRAVDNGQYEARQRQRAIERGIRGWKNRETASLDPDKAAYSREHLRAWQGRMREHLADNPDLLRRRYREQPGTGNAPTTGLRERYPNGPTPLGTTPARPAAPARTPAQLADHYRDTVGELKPAERDALRRYTANEFVGVNTWLNPASSFVDVAAPLVRDLTRLTNRYRLPEQVTARRYLDADALPGDLTPGRVWTDRGFSSTTLDDQPPQLFRGKPVELQITVPQGSRGVIVNGAGSRGLGVAAENELLLPPGTRYRILGEDMRDGRRVIQVVALPPTRGGAARG